jgi:hypothetical protein
MSTDLLNILKRAQKLPIEERRELADLLLEDLDKVQSDDKEMQVARAIVAETSGSMAGLDRATLIRLAEDEEFSGY